MGSCRFLSAKLLRNAAIHMRARMPLRGPRWMMAFSEDIASMALQVVRWFTASVRRSLLFVGSAERPVHPFVMAVCSGHLIW